MIATHQAICYVIRTRMNLPYENSNSTVFYTGGKKSLKLRSTDQAIQMPIVPRLPFHPKDEIQSPRTLAPFGCVHLWMPNENEQSPWSARSVLHTASRLLHKALKEPRTCRLWSCRYSADWYQEWIALQLNTFERTQGSFNILIRLFFSFTVNCLHSRAMSWMPIVKFTAGL